MTKTDTLINSDKDIKTPFVGDRLDGRLDVFEVVPQLIHLHLHSHLGVVGVVSNLRKTNILIFQKI